MADPENRRTDVRASLRSAALEAGLVVLGVVLAFAANEWRKANEAGERAGLALEAVARELEANHDAVSASLAYHREKMFALYSAGGSSEAVEPSDFDKGFVFPARILSNAWDAATATDAVLAWDYDLLLAVSRLYADQEQYEVQTRGVAQVIYSQLLTSGARGIVERPEQLASIVSSFWWRECELLARCCPRSAPSRPRFRTAALAPTVEQRIDQLDHIHRCLAG
ncbi:MAG: hypothetical protein MPN21_19410 [Thermoanaerobaculia bacterium]|nr:hypothetical protein [Thermoanaerobaculia bacterium]